MTAEYGKESFYRDTKITEFYLDIWEPRVVVPSDTDQEYIIEPKYSMRPDLLSKDVYGDERLWWVLMLRNKDVLVDPLNDFLPGLKIYIPDASSFR